MTQCRHLYYRGLNEVITNTILCGFLITVSPIKLETGLRPNSAGIPYTLLLRIEAMGFPTFRLLLYIVIVEYPPKPYSNY